MNNQRNSNGVTIEQMGDQTMGLRVNYLNQANNGVKSGIKWKAGELKAGGLKAGGRVLKGRRKDAERRNGSQCGVNRYVLKQQSMAERKGQTSGSGPQSDINQISETVRRTGGQIQKMGGRK